MKERTDAKGIKGSKLRRGLIVFAALAVLTAAEFAISIGLQNPLPWLTVIAIAKGGLIVAYFMRVMQLWREEVGG